MHATDSTRRTIAKRCALQPTHSAPPLGALPSGKRLFGALLLGVLLFHAPAPLDGQVGGEDRIIVSGASGQLGGLVVERLLELGVNPERLILVSRTPESLSRHAEMGASTRFGDFAEPESLPTAFAGGSRMLLVSISTVGPERPGLHKNAIDAAVAAGVRHIAYTSFVDAEEDPSPIANDHRQTEAFLRESGVAWTMLRNQLYMDGIVGQATRMLTTGEVTVAANATRTAYVTREDCAAAAAAALAAPGHENRICEITGSEAIGPEEIARIASEVAGVSIAVVQAAPTGGVPGGGGTPGSSGVTSTAVAELTGRPPTTAREFLVENRAALVAAAAARTGG